MALSLTTQTLKTLTQFPIFFNPSPPSNHRPTTIIRLSRWNNANAEKFIRQKETQKQLEDDLRFDKRFELANIISATTPTTAPPPYKSTGAPSSPSRPSIPAKKSKYTRNPNPRYDDVTNRVRGVDDVTNDKNVRSRNFDDLSNEKTVGRIKFDDVSNDKNVRDGNFDDVSNDENIVTRSFDDVSNHKRVGVRGVGDVSSGYKYPAFEKNTRNKGFDDVSNDKRHPAFQKSNRIRRVDDVRNDDVIKVGENGLSYVLPDAPFEFQYSYTETPKVKPVKLREAAVAPFGPGTMPRPWTGRKPLGPSKKNLPEFDSFVLPKAHKKGVKPVQAPGPFLPGTGPKYVKTREELLGEDLSKEEVDELIKGCLKSDRQLNMGRDGLTHNMLDNIHAHWKRRRVCKIKCKGVCTVDMDNVRQQLEEKTGGKIIYSKGGVVYLFRGRNYNHKTRPVFPLMLWKPITPVYPRLIQRAPEGLTLGEANEMRHKGRQLIPICKLGKNGVYCDLAKNVREAFETCDLVRINCEGMNGSDYRKIGAKLKDLVPCVLISFENEHILMWRGQDWKSMFTQENEPLEAKNNPDTEIDLLVASLESSPEDLTEDESEEDEIVNSTLENFDDDKNITPNDSEDDISETTSKRDCLEGVMSLLNQAVQDGIATVLEDSSLDADVVYAMAVAFAKSALPGPTFRHHRLNKVAIETIEKKQETDERVGQEVVKASERKKGTKMKTSPGTRKKENYLDVVPQATLRVDELAKLLG